MHSKEKVTWLSNILPEGPCIDPTAEMLSASQPGLKVMMYVETGKLLEMRRKLENEIERVSEKYISSHPQETKSCLDKIKELRSEYIYDIRDFFDMYKQVLEEPAVLDEWTKELKEISLKVRVHANKISAFALTLATSPPPRPRHLNTSLLVTEVRARVVMDRDSRSLPSTIIPVPKLSCMDTALPLAIDNILPDLTPHTRLLFSQK